MTLLMFMESVLGKHKGQYQTCNVLDHLQLKKVVNETIVTHYFNKIFHLLMLIIFFTALWTLYHKN